MRSAGRCEPVPALRTWGGDVPCWGLEWLAPPYRVSCLILPPHPLPPGSAQVENFLAACPDPRTQGLRSGTRNPRSQGRCGNRLAAQE